MGKLRDQTHNEGFHFKRRPDMLPLEAINRIRVLSERGMGSKAIAKSMGISRNTVRKYPEFLGNLGSRGAPPC